MGAFANHSLAGRRGPWDQPGASAASAVEVDGNAESFDAGPRRLRRRPSLSGYDVPCFSVKERGLIGLMGRGWGGRAQDPARKAPPYPAGRLGGAAVLAAVVTGYLAWGAWVSAANSRWLYLTQAWWRTWLRPGHVEAPLALAVLWLAALLCSGGRAAGATGGGAGHRGRDGGGSGGAPTCSARTRRRGGRDRGRGGGLDAPSSSGNRLSDPFASVDAPQSSWPGSTRDHQPGGEPGGGAVRGRRGARKEPLGSLWAGLVWDVNGADGPACSDDAPAAAAGPVTLAGQHRGH